MFEIFVNKKIYRVCAGNIAEESQLSTNPFVGTYFVGVVGFKSANFRIMVSTLVVPGKIYFEILIYSKIK